MHKRPSESSAFFSYSAAGGVAACISAACRESCAGAMLYAKHAVLVLAKQGKSKARCFKHYASAFFNARGAAQKQRLKGPLSKYNF